MTEGLYKTDNIIINALKGQGFKTVTFGDVTMVDMSKQKILPAVHIGIISQNLNKGAIIISYEMVLMDVIDENDLDPRKMENPFGLTNNLEDLFHDLAFRFNKAYLTMRKDMASNITLDESVTLEALYDIGQNKYSGYYVTFSITTPNGGIC